MFVNNMIKKLEEVTVSYTRFCIEIGRNNSNPICLVEGKDATYYRVRVKSNCAGKEPIFISCGGKKRVIETFNLVYKNGYYSKAKIFVFVDKDFDKQMNNPFIYETPCYSIENFYTSTNVLKTILKDEFTINEFDDLNDYNTCIELYTNAQKKFHEAIMELNVWIFCQKKLNEDGLASKINLGDKHNHIMDKFLSVTILNVKKNYTINDIELIFPEAATITDELFNEVNERMLSQDYQKIFRGKYEIDFFKKFLKKLITELNRKKENQKFFLKKRTISFKVSDSDMLSQLSQHADTPTCLLNYIQKIWSGA